MILAGDVGGSKVNLALFHENGGTPRLAVERSYVSRDYPGPVPLLESFLKETQPRITRACLGVAGPVHDGRCRITPEILPLLKTDPFLVTFRDQRKFRDLLAQVPVQAVMNKQAPLTGAAYFALGETAIQ